MLRYEQSILHLVHGAPTQGWQYQTVRRDKTTKREKKSKLKKKRPDYLLVLLCCKAKITPQRTGQIQIAESEFPTILN